MKKTQSLKLMLLGLMTSVSTSALAAVGDVFDSGDNAGGQLYYQQITANGVKLIGVKTVGQGGNIVIPTKALNSWMNKNNNLDVIEVADDWSLATQIVLQKVDANGNVLESYPQGKSKALTDYEGTIKLTIEAEQLKTISTKALQPLHGKISKFVVAGPDATTTPAKLGAGLTAIPDYAFYCADATFTPNSVDIRDAQKEVDKLTVGNAAFDFPPISSREYCGGQYEGKDVWYINATYGYVTFGKKVDAVALHFAATTGNPDEEANDWYEAISINSLQRVGYIRESSDDTYPGVRFRATPEATSNIANYGPDPQGAITPCELMPGLLELFNAARPALQTANGNLTAVQQATAYINLKKDVTDKEAALKALTDLRALAELKGIVNLWGNTHYATPAVANAIKNCLIDIDNSTDPVSHPLYDALSDNEKTAYQTVLTTLQTVVWPTNSTGNLDATGYDIYDAITEEGKIQQAENDLAGAKIALQNYYDTNIAPYAQAQADAQATYDRINALLGTYNALLAEALAKAEKDLADAQQGAFSWENAADNEVLTRVDLLGEKIESIGESAFENCTKAQFGNIIDSRLPLSTKTIGNSAFRHTRIQPKFTGASNGNLTNLESIGNYAFADPVNNGTVNADFTTNPNLKSFGEHVFDNVHLKTLLLAGTAIKDYDYPEALAQYLYQETPKFVDDCGNFYNYDVTKAEDVAALKALGFSDEEIGAGVTDPENVGFGWRNGGEAKVNQTLTKASLPEAIKAIPADAFMNDIALATLEGGIPVPVETIGARAFFRTKIKEFNLTDNINLTSVGSQAFAGNSELTKVILPQDKKDASGNVIAEAKLTTLGAGVFECDGDLGEVVLSPDITCLPAGTFAGNNKMKTLDLSNTQIEVLYNLFGTEELIKNNKYNERYKDEHANTSLTKIILPEQKIDETDNKTVLIPGLKIIDEYALAYMQGLTDVTIPSSVFWMGDGVFYNDANLKTVTAMDSRLVTIGVNTFRNCRKLETFTFVTLNVVDPYGDTLEDVELDDLIEAGEITNVCDLRSLPELNPFFDDHNFFMTNATTLIMTKESIKALQDVMPTEIGFTNFQIWQPVLLTHTDGTLPYYNENYATWIKMDQADVYTCYQDVVDQVVKIYMVKAKHNQGFYKIPAATTFVGGDGVSTSDINWRPDNSVYTFPGYNDTFMDWYIDGPAQDFSSEAPYSLFTPSAAVIIVEKANGGADGIKGQIPYERHSAANLISQSTLDPGNQMKITRKPLDKLSSSSNIMWYAHSGNEPNTWHGPITDGVIPAGKLVLPLSAGQANGNDPLPSRIEVIWLDDDLTGIMDVKDYIKSLNDSEAIYNLQGVKVTAPVKGQMYIQGGKKFIQK